MNISCPDEILLARFMQDKLSNKEKEYVLSHLAECYKCLQMVSTTYRMLKDEELLNEEEYSISYEQAKEIYLNAKKDTLLEKIEKKSKRIYTIISDIFEDIKFRYFTPGLILEPGFAKIRGSQNTDNQHYNPIIKQFKKISLQLVIISNENNKSTLQVKVLKVHSKWKDARLFIKHETGALISSRSISENIIEFMRLKDEKYNIVIENIDNSEQLQFNIEIKQENLTLAQMVQ